MLGAMPRGMAVGGRQHSRNQVAEVEAAMVVRDGPRPAGALCTIGDDSNAFGHGQPPKMALSAESWDSDMGSSYSRRAQNLSG